MAGHMRQKKQQIFGFTPPISLDIYSALYFILCISVCVYLRKLMDNSKKGQLGQTIFGIF